MPYEKTVAHIIDTPSHPGSWQKSRVGVVWEWHGRRPSSVRHDKDNTEAKKRGKGFLPKTRRHETETS